MQWRAQFYTVIEKQRDISAEPDIENQGLPKNMLYTPNSSP